MSRRTFGLENYTRNEEVHRPRNQDDIPLPNSGYGYKTNFGVGRLFEKFLFV